MLLKPRTDAEPLMPVPFVASINSDETCRILDADIRRPSAECNLGGSSQSYLCNLAVCMSLQRTTESGGVNRFERFRKLFFLLHLRSALATGKIHARQ